MKTAHDANVTNQFGPRASAYVESAVHSQGEDLVRVAEIAGNLRPAQAIDLGCGGGHVAYAMARHAGKVTATDLSSDMLAAVVATAKAKGELVEALPDAGDGGLAVLNADDELVAAMAGRTAARILLYGRAARADVRAGDVQMDGGRARFTLAAGGESAPVALRYLGAHQVSNEPRCTKT